MADDISHPSDLVKTMQAYPLAFLKLSERNVTEVRQGISFPSKRPAYMLINPGSLNGDYFCKSVSEKAVMSLEECNELEFVSPGKWKLRVGAKL